MVLIYSLKAGFYYRIQIFRKYRLENSSKRIHLFFSQWIFNSDTEIFYNAL